MNVYLDASLSKAVIGIGVQVVESAERRVDIGVPLRSGLNSTEAELYALNIAIDIAMSMIDRPDGHTTKVDVVFHMDCEPAIKSLYGLTMLRSEAARTLVKKTLKRLDDAKEKHFLSWQIEPIKSENNPAHELAKNARIRWRDIWKPIR